MSYRVFSSYPSLSQIPLNIIISLKIELYSREEMNQFYIIEIKINFSFYELIWRQTRDLRTEEKKMKNTFLPDTAMITVSVTKNMKGNVIEESSKINVDFKHIVGKVSIYSMFHVERKLTPCNV